MSSIVYNEEMQNIPYILIILNCKKYIEKAIQQKNTWIPHIPKELVYYHVIGDININEDFSFDNENRILYVKTQDDYISLPKKVIYAYEAVHKTFNYKYIFKTDDDQTLLYNNFFPQLINNLENNKNPSHYGGKILNIQEHISKYYLIHSELPQNILMKKCTYCNGRFYFLSNTAVEYLISQKENIKKEYFEDYSIGINLADNLKKNIMYIESSIFFKDYIKV
jgi:hypothetical protein